MPLKDLSDAQLGRRLGQLLDRMVDAQYGRGKWPSGREVGSLFRELRRRGWLDEDDQPTGRYLRQLARRRREG